MEEITVPRRMSGEEEGLALEEETIAKTAMNGVIEEGREMVAVLDAGAQYGKIIDRRVRELNIETIMLPLNTPIHDLEKHRLKAIIITGSGNSVNDVNPFTYDSGIFSLGIPILGICYGFHLIVKHYGGEIVAGFTREDGQFEVKLDTSSPLFKAMAETQQVLLTHGDSAHSLPECLLATGWSGDLLTAVSHVDKLVYGVQFHPEVDLSENGHQIFHNFLYEISGCHGLFKLSSREEACLRYIKETVGDSNVLSLVSGGVDSTVCTALLCKAIGQERVTAVHIDNGFMRKGEKEQVISSLGAFGINLKVHNAGHRFINSRTMMDYRDQDGLVYRQATPLLHTVTNAEEKRHIIGDTFMHLATEFMNQLQQNGEKIFLAQGTLRPDLIESASSLASSKAHVIKTHHNDTTLVRSMRNKGLVVEPLKDFHKDEVRILGESLGIPQDLVYRHPFPGPGLAIRVICQDEAYITDMFTQTNMILGAIATYYTCVQTGNAAVKLIQDCTSQLEQEFLLSFTGSISLSAILLPIYSVGVQGDCRTYSYVAALSSDQPPVWSELIVLAKLIPRICHSINRVVWVFGECVRSHITDVTPTHLTQQVLATLREADHIAQSILKSHGLIRNVSQMPVVLIPIHFDRNPEQRPVIPSCQRSVVIRTFITSDFMTGIPAVPDKHIPNSVLEEMVIGIKQTPGISRVLYDLTPKPPGTTEWE